MNFVCVALTLHTQIKYVLMNKKFKERTEFNLSQINKDVLAEWDENNIERRSISEREDCPQYTFYEGPRLTDTPAYIMYWLEQ